MTRIRYRSWNEVPLVLNLEQLCVVLNCTDKTAKQLLVSGKIKANKDGRCWRIDREMVREYLRG